MMHQTSDTLIETYGSKASTTSFCSIRKTRCLHTGYTAIFSDRGLSRREQVCLMKLRFDDEIVIPQNVASLNILVHYV